MKLLKFLLKSSPKIAILVALAGVVSGLSSAALIALINSAIHATEITGILIAGVAIIGFLKIGTGAASGWLSIRFSQITLLNLSVRLCRKFMTAPFIRLEETGAHRVLAALTADVQILGAAIQTIPGLVVNIAIVIGVGSYLAWLYPAGCLLLVVVVILGAIFYSFLHSVAFKAIYEAREKRDVLMGSYRGLTDGIKELKMHQGRGNEFISDRIESTSRELQALNLVAAKRYIALDTWNQFLFYLLVAGALFLFPRDNPNSSEVLTGYIFAGFYIMNPIWSLIGSVPTFLSGKVSMDKVEDLGVALGDNSSEQKKTAVENAEPVTDPTIELRRVTFEYPEPDSDDYPFALGPLDLSLKPGEITFIVGGNGSGKSTLVKLLAGLYAPQSGEILLGGRSVGDQQRIWYREQISVVFSDFYLFDGLLGASGADIDMLSNEHLKKLELDDKVQVSDRLFTTTNLSQGQRKRLALLTALIEERPINIFDEWAADQDPHYKEIFYSQLLPELKAKGKTVIVITHDDRYFHLGDRVIKLEDGKLIGTEWQTNIPSQTPAAQH